MGGVSSAWALAGVRVGVLQARYARELTALIEREGGSVLLAPCLREVRSEPRKDDEAGYTSGKRDTDRNEQERRAAQLVCNGLMTSVDERVPHLLKDRGERVAQ